MNKSIADSENLVNIYEKMLQENMASADVVGGSEFVMGIENEDSYATDDMRNPFGLGITTRKGKINPKGKKGKKKSKVAAKSAQNFH